MSVARTIEIRPGALYRLGLFLARHARAVLAIGLLLLLGAAVLGTRAFGELQSGGFDDPGSESYRAAQLSADHFPSGPNLVVLVTAHDGVITGPADMQAGQDVTSRLAALPNVTVTASYFTTPAAALMSRDGRSALILMKVGGSQGQTVTRSSDVSRAVGGDRGAVSVSVGGSSGVFSDINEHVASSLVKAEAIAVPVTLLLLLLVFGSLVAALLPLLIGTFAIVGTFAELAVLGSITDVSVFAINLTTALGLGLGIDYGLLIVARFREQLATGQDVPEAVARTVVTAGRTILFSAAAVAAALATLTLFPLYFLSSFGDAGVGVVIIAAGAALIVTPAALALLGHRVDKGRVPFVKAVRGSESPFWGRVARTVFRHPVAAATPVLVLLLLAATPILGIHFALPDVTVLPTTAPSRVVADTLDAQFPSQADAVLVAYSPGPETTDAARTAAAQLVDLPGVTSVDYAGGTRLPGGATAPPDLSTVYSHDGYQRLAVNTSLPSGSEAARDLVATVRATPHGDFLIGGGTAGLADTLAGIARPLPLALGIIVVATFVLLFLFTGSVVQPLRALVVNSLSLAAAVGIATWVFQDGHLIRAFGATARPMDASMTVLLLCITFGLSMDYEVFLSSRITELHRSGADLAPAVTGGLARTGRIVTSAALLLAVSFFAFTTSSVSMLQLFGLGAGLAVLIDATLVRGVLVPAIMRLLGPANFYAPRPLRRLYARIGLAEE